MKRLFNFQFRLKIMFVLIAIFSLAIFVNADPSCKTNESESDCKTRLLSDQKKLEAEVKKIEGDIKQEGGKQKTLSGEINKLTGEIQKTSSAISKKNTLIQNIRNEITGKEKSLDGLNQKLRREKESLEKILRKRYELGDATLFEVILSSKRISKFYEDAPAFSYVQSSLSDSFSYIAKLKEDIYGEKTSLEKKKTVENNAKYSLTLEKGKIESQKKDRNTALKVSKSKEASLAQLKKLREQEIAKIRSVLISFQGSGVTSRSISFGEAYDYAKNTEKKTGVRAALVMAIMQQESGFGNNVGGCYLKEKPISPVGGVYKYNGIYIKSGNPSKKNMIPNHFGAFVRITSALGLNWQTTPISCAMILSNGSLYGHGGAMGYTQFIPGTWELVSSRVSSYLGITIANPWNPRDAVMATGVFMKDKGASLQTYASEYKAACGYFGSCRVYDYGTSVMKKAASIQNTIYTLERD